MCYRSILQLLLPFGGYSSIRQPSISDRNEPQPHIKKFTGALISHNAHNHPMDVATLMFLCSRQCSNGQLIVVSKITHKTVVNFCLIKSTVYVSMHLNAVRGLQCYQPVTKYSLLQCNVVTTEVSYSVILHSRFQCFTRLHSYFGMNLMMPLKKVVATDYLINGILLMIFWVKGHRNYCKEAMIVLSQYHCLLSNSMAAQLK